MTIERFIGSWSEEFPNTKSFYYYDSNGKVLGFVVKFGDLYKALVDNLFIGWYIDEGSAKTAVAEAYRAKQEQSNGSP